MTDAALAHIARLTHVRLLQANGEAVTDAGLASLSRLPDLRALSLENMPHVTDAGLAHLQRLATLESLRLVGVPVSESRVAAFKAALQYRVSAGRSLGKMTPVSPLCAPAPANA